MSSPQRKTLLIVDDEEEILQSLAMSLEADGWDCRCYSSWPQASEEIPARLRPDVALVDLNLAGENPADGLVVMEELLRRLPDLAIVALTGSPDYHDAARKCLNAGAVQFVRKPALADEVHERLLHAVWIKQRDIKARALERAEELAATKAQQALLPQEPPCVDGLKIEQFYQPTRMVLGDYFDYIMLPQTQDIVVAIGDATGHGVPAALMAHVVGGGAAGDLPGGRGRFLAGPGPGGDQPRGRRPPPGNRLHDAVCRTDRRAIASADLRPRRARVSHHLPRHGNGISRTRGAPLGHRSAHGLSRLDAPARPRRASADVHRRRHQPVLLR